MPSMKSKLMLAVLLMVSVCVSLISGHAIALDRRNLHRMSFEETVNRYPSPLALIESIKSIVPNQESVGLHDSCLQIGAASSAVLGAIDPSQIQPLEQTPGALFFNYFEKCVKKVMRLGFQSENLAKQNSEAILGSEISRSLLNGSGQRELITAWATPFARLPPTTQDQLVDQFIYFLLGPDEVLRYYKYIGEANVFGRPLQTTAELRRFLIDQMMKIPNSQTDSISEFYSRLAVLLRLGPALKN